MRSLRLTPLLILIPALFSSCGTRGNVKAGGGYDNGGINGGVAVEVGWGNPAPAPIPRTIYPDPAMVGLCYREDTINEDGTITPPGDPIVSLEHRSRFPRRPVAISATSSSGAKS